MPSDDANVDGRQWNHSYLVSAQVTKLLADIAKDNQYLKREFVNTRLMKVR